MCVGRLGMGVKDQRYYPKRFCTGVRDPRYYLKSYVWVLETHGGIRKVLLPKRKHMVISSLRPRVK